MRRVLHVLRLVWGIAVRLALLAAAALAFLVWLTLPPSSQTAAIPGLSAPVEVSFDADGIPRIHAATARDAAAALGFVHARDRLFQMELMRRNASGRLSELAGPATLPLDRMMRTLGLRASAEADLAALDGETRAMLEAYAAGVNGWIAARGRLAAPEFLVFGAPEPWTATDSLLWAKTMGLFLSGNWRTELARLALAGRLAPARIDELWPPDGAAGHPDAALAPGPAAAAARLAARLPGFPAEFTQPDRASNAWAVDGRHSATGRPLLAGDPHLGFGQPGIWYLARIETPTGVLAGATAPGVPFLVLGQNGHIAWSFTTTGADVQDVFIETPTPEGGYATPDGPRPFTLRQERIRVRGGPDQVLVVRQTRHGPVISDLDRPDGRDGGQRDRPVLAVAMANLAPGDTAAAGLLALNRAEDLDEAGRAAARISSPVQNLLVAERGRIGLFVTGRVPLRRAGDGAAPAAGADGAHDWVGFASGTQLPRIVDPPSGRLVNANERVAPADFPVFLGRDWYGGWRAARIRTLLAGSDRHGVDDFVAMQRDTRSDYAAGLLPVLRRLPPLPGLAGRAQALLADRPGGEPGLDRPTEGRPAADELGGPGPGQRGPGQRGPEHPGSRPGAWEGDMAMDLPQPLIFNAWMRRFHDAVLTAPDLPEGLAGTRAGPEAEFTAFVLSPAGAQWCGGDCTRLLGNSLAAAMAGLASRFGPDPAAWRWGAAHQAVFAQPLLRAIPVLGGLTTARIDSPGDGGTIDRGEMAGDRGEMAGDRGEMAGAGFDAVHGPSYRGVYDLADPDRSRFVVAPGQSGNPVSRHARDFLARWRDGGTITLGPVPDRVSATLRLVP